MCLLYCCVLVTPLAVVSLWLSLWLWLWLWLSPACLLGPAGVASRMVLEYLLMNTSSAARFDRVLVQHYSRGASKQLLAHR